MPACPTCGAPATLEHDHNPPQVPARPFLRMRRELGGTPEVRRIVEEASQRVAELGLTETVHYEWPPSERRISATLERD